VSASVRAYRFRYSKNCHEARRKTMENTPVGKDNEPPARGAAQNGPSGGMDWHQRAGPIFKYGLAAGFALILLGGMSLNLSLTNTFVEMLVICAGLSIILGAFGSTASVTIPSQSIVLVGVAGIAVALFILLLSQMDDRYVRVTIEGDVGGAQVELVGDRNYLGAFQKSERFFDFIIFGKEIRRPVLALYITLPDKTEFPFECIAKDKVRPYLASGKTISWSFNKENAALLNTVDRQRIAELGPCRENINTAVTALYERLRLASTFRLISMAFAQSDTASTTRDTKTLIEQLESSASYVRRDARSRLAEKGIPVVEPLLAKLSEESLTYPSRLGVIVALTEMMRKNKRYREQIIDRIKEEDLGRLVNASADEDRTIRIYASEFLYDLGDPRTISRALDRFPTASEDGRYNLLIVIKGAVPFALDKQRDEVIRRVTALKSERTPKTNDLIDSIIDLARRS
jgi:hypothetical protein